MAILYDVEIHFCKLDPERPSAQFNKKNPSWELQMRTTDKEQKKVWVDHGIKVTAVREDDDGPVLYWRANLRKKSIKADGSNAEPPKVQNGELADINPNTIGNGSIANLRIFQYDFKDSETQVEGKASVLMGIQLTNHKVYAPKPRNSDDDFVKTTTVTVAAPVDEDDTPVVKTPIVTPTIADDLDDEIAY